MPPIDELQPPAEVSTRKRSDDCHQETDKEQERIQLAGFTRVVGAPNPPPLKLPEFLLKDLRAAVPKHCFERSLATSMSFLAKDLFIMFYVAYQFNNSEPSTQSQVIFWPVYWLIRGTYLGAVTCATTSCPRSRSTMPLKPRLCCVLCLARTTS